MSLVASLLWAAPLAAHASVELHAHDSLAGLSTTMELSGVQANAELLVSIIPPFGEELLYEAAADEHGEAQARIAGADVEEAGSYAVVVTDANGATLTEGAFSVLSDSVDFANSALQVDRGYLETDGEDSVTASVILRDRYGNPLAGRPVQLISSRPGDVIEPLSRETDDRGEQQFLITTTQAGTVSLRAIDLISGDVLDSQAEFVAGTPGYSVGGSPSPASASQRSPAARSQGRQTLYAPSQYGSPLVGDLLGRRLYGQVNAFDVVDSFILEMVDEMQVNLDENLVITAIDANGRVVEDYVGTVLLASTDPDAVLPSFGEVTFKGSDLGRKKLVLGLRFSTPGEHILYAEDKDDASVNGQAVIYVAGDETYLPQELIYITEPRQNETLNDAELVVVGNGPPFVDIVVASLEASDDPENPEEYTIGFGDTDVNGDFAIPIKLDTDQTEHTIRVSNRDKNNPVVSEKITLKLDVTPPVITKLTFDPPNPVEETEVIVTAEIVEDGSGIDSILFTIDEEEYAIEPVDELPGTYQATFTLEDPGTYQPVLAVTDKAGNTDEVRGSVEVVEKGLPQVQNVEAEPKSNSVSLRWDPLILEDEDIDAYRIYVGEEKDDFLYTLDTDRATSAATVAGLQPGATYYFAVTALQGKRESEEKSKVAQATVLGLKLQVEPRDSNLALKWTPLNDSIPLANYRLEYGIEPGAYTEQRIINGDLTGYVIKDLLNEIRYYLRLTPITTTGEVMDNLTAEGQGTPTTERAGFHPGAPDPVPPSLVGSLPRETPPPITRTEDPPTKQPDTGIPSGMWWLLLTGAVFGIVVHVQRRRAHQATHEFLQTMQQHYWTSEHAQQSTASTSPRFI